MLLEMRRASSIVSISGSVSVRASLSRADVSKRLAVSAFTTYPPGMRSAVHGGLKRRAIRQRAWPTCPWGAEARGSVAHDNARSHVGWNDGELLSEPDEIVGWNDGELLSEPDEIHDRAHSAGASRRFLVANQPIWWPIDVARGRQAILPGLGGPGQLLTGGILVGAALWRAQREAAPGDGGSHLYGASSGVHFGEPRNGEEITVTCIGLPFPY
jgi:hypothetical protein